MLERAGRLGTILFDKTGTLTTGSLQLCHAVAFSDTMTTERWTVHHPVLPLSCISYSVITRMRFLGVGLLTFAMLTL